MSSKKKKPKTLAAVLEPVKDIYTKALAGDDEARRVFNDWLEDQNASVAEAMWFATKPTTPQQRVTITIIARSSSVGQIEHALRERRKSIDPDGFYRYIEDVQGIPHPRYAPHILVEAHRQFLIHPHTHWIRLITGSAQTRAGELEVVLDNHNTIDIRGLEDCLILRARCRVPGCVTTSFGSHVVEKIVRLSRREAYLAEAKAAAEEPWPTSP